MDSFTFTCQGCGQDFEVKVRDYNFGGDVTCPSCGAVFGTDYEDSDDGLIGPWLTSRQSSD